MILCLKRKEAKKEGSIFFLFLVQTIMVSNIMTLNQVDKCEMILSNTSLFVQIYIVLITENIIQQQRIE